MGGAGSSQVKAVGAGDACIVVHAGPITVLRWRFLFWLWPALLYKNEKRLVVVPFVVALTGD